MALNLATTNTPLAGLHDYQQLVLGPLLEQSKVLQHVRVIQTDASVVHIPTAKAAATGWYAEHAEIAQADDLIDELVVTPTKCASLAVISNELAMDTSPGAAATIGGIHDEIIVECDEGDTGEVARAMEQGMSHRRHPVLDVPIRVEGGVLGRAWTKR